MTSSPLPSPAQFSPAPRNTLSPNIEDKDLYKAVLDTRNLEISLFWQRSNYFLVLNSALALGFFNLKEPRYALALALFGIVASLLWFRVVAGSKYWQARWEHRLRVIECQVAPGLHLFSATWKTIDEDVNEGLKGKQAETGLQRWLARQVRKKQSVSYNMMLLSLLFILAWALLALDGAWHVVHRVA